MYLIGGMNSNGGPTRTNTGTQVFDIRARTFTNIPGQLSVGRANHACTVLEGEELLIVAGGVADSWIATDSVEILDLTTETWSNAKVMPRAEKAWAAGGRIFTWGAIKLFQYELAVNEWEEVDDASFDLNRIAHNFVPVDTGVYNICPFL